MIAVKLDNLHIGAGPGTVIANVNTIREFLALAHDRDGARDRSVRLWTGSYPVGARVVSSLVTGTGIGVTGLVRK